MGLRPGLLQCLGAAFGPLLNAGNEALGSLFERFASGGCGVLRHRPPIRLYAPGGFEQLGERPLFLACPLLRHLGLAEPKRPLEPVVQRALVGSRHVAQ